MSSNNNIESLTIEYQLQKQIDASADWKLVRKRIIAYERRRYAFSLLKNVAAILLPFVLIYQFALYPIIQEHKSDKNTISITSATGVITKTVLPDGSEVWINSQSTLTYPQHFSRKHRTVSLTGEAFFNVSASKKHKFNVVTPQGYTISAYGTEFNVNTYNDNPNCEVTLANGNIELDTDRTDNPLSLNVNEKAIIDKSTGEISIYPADTYVDIAWKDGKLVFRRANLHKVVDRLSKKFGVDFILDGEGLTEYEYTATFIDESLEDILELLKISAPITYTIQKQKQLNNNTFTHKEVVIKLNN